MVRRTSKCTRGGRRVLPRGRSKLERDLGYVAQRSVDNAISDLRDAFAAGKVPNPATDDRYYNIKRMQTRKLQ